MSDTMTGSRRVPRLLPDAPDPSGRPDAEPGNPFIGPVPFGRGDVRFFGRERETQELVSYVFSQPVVLVYSPSGAGKSSLVNAGVIPVLERQHGFQVLPVARVRGRWDLEAAEDVPCFYTYQAIVSMDPLLPPAQARDLTLAQFLDRWPRPLDDDDAPCPRVVVLDQFEEILAVYSDRSAEQQQRFFEQVAEALRRDPRLRIVWLVREDRVSQLEPFARLLPCGLGLRYHLEHLTAQAALDAVLRTTEGSSRWFSRAAAEAVVEQLLKTRAEVRPGHFALVNGTRVEPVQLQVVCRSVWDRAAPGEIRPEDLVRFGDIGDVLADYYDAAVAHTVLATGVDEGMLRDWFSRRLITEMHTRGTVFRGPELTDDVLPVPNSVVDELEARHIIRGERRSEGGGQWYELVHDTFIDPILAANAKWHRRAGPPWLGVVRAVAPLVVVALVLLLVALSDRDQRGPVRASLRGELTASDPADEHALGLWGAGGMGVAVRVQGGALEELVLRTPTGREVVGRDADPGPLFQAVFDDLQRGPHALVLRGSASDVPVTYEARVVEGSVLTVGGSRRDATWPGHDRPYLLTGTGSEQHLVLTAAAFGTLVVTTLDGSPVFVSELATGCDGGATGAGDGWGDPGAGAAFDSVSTFPSRRGQVYAVYVESYGPSGRLDYDLGVREPRALAAPHPGTGHGGTLAPLDSVRTPLDATSRTLGLSSPDGGQLGVRVTTATGDVLVEEVVSSRDRAGLQLDLPAAAQRFLTILNQGCSTAGYRLTVAGGRGPS